MFKLMGAALPVLFLFVGAAKAQTPHACHAFTADAPMVTQTLYMPLEDVSHTLRMPLIYFEDRFDRVDGQVYEGQLLSVMNEAFTPVTRPQTAELNKAGNRAYMTFVMHDFVPLDLVLGISAGALDRKVGRDLALFEENDAPFDLAKVTPCAGAIIQTRCATTKTFAWRGMRLATSW
ncbi:MAG: hypothetical protein P8J02_09800 [Yoonia sp.]|nr:hypothetical protein [Yoonia sp.]